MSTDSIPSSFELLDGEGNVLIQAVFSDFTPGTPDPSVFGILVTKDYRTNLVHLNITGTAVVLDQKRFTQIEIVNSADFLLPTMYSLTFY